MQRTVCSSVLAIALTAVAAAAEGRAIDYRKIDRPIGREPEYESDEPLFGLMLFGREAPLRVWIVLDGDTVYLDRNGDGDLTADDERFATLKDCKGVEIQLPGGATPSRRSGATTTRSRPACTSCRTSISPDRWSTGNTGTWPWRTRRSRRSWRTTTGR